MSQRGVRIQGARHLQDLRSSGLESFTSDEAADIFGITSSGANAFMRRQEAKGVLYRVGPARWSFTDAAYVAPPRRGHPSNGLPEAAMAALPESVSITDIRKIFGVERGTEILQLIAAAHYRPILVTAGDVQFTIDVMIHGVAPGKQSHRLGRVFRRFLQDDPIARKRFTMWTKGSQWQSADS